MSYQVYRQSKLGDCLVEALDELITNEKITPALAMKILAEVLDSGRMSAHMHNCVMLWLNLPSLTVCVGLCSSTR
jgi:Transcription initiation factor IIA, gamma subunit, helical domain